VTQADTAAVPQLVSFLLLLATTAGESTRSCVAATTPDRLRVNAAAVADAAAHRRRNDVIEGVERLVLSSKDVEQPITRFQPVARHVIHIRHMKQGCTTKENTTTYEKHIG